MDYTIEVREFLTRGDNIHRPHKMEDITRHISALHPEKSKSSIRQQLLRVMHTFVDFGLIHDLPRNLKRGRYYTYQWKLPL